MIVELLKAGAVKALPIAVNGQRSIALAAGDILKVPDGDVQLLQQGADLVVLAWMPGAADPVRLVVSNFFASGSLAMVQVGPDSAPQVVTPATQLGSAAGAPARGQDGSDADDESDPQLAGPAATAGTIRAQLLSDLALDDAGLQMFELPRNALPSLEVAPLVAGARVQDDDGAFVLPAQPEAAYGSVALVDPPTFDPLDNGGVLALAHLQAGHYVLSGRGADGMQLVLVLQGSAGRVVRTATVSGGTWQAVLDAADIALLGEGALRATATHVSRSGQPMSNPGVAELHIDTVAPAVPALVFEDGLADRLVTASEWNGDAGLRVSGLAEAGSRVQLTLVDGDGKIVQAVVQADASGHWQLNLRPLLGALADGTVLVDVHGTDAAGNPSGMSADQFALRRNPPPPPQALALTAETDTAARDNITSLAAPVIEGQTGAHYRVRVYRDGDMDGVAGHAEYLGTVVADAQGRFLFPVPAGLNLSDGSHQFLFDAEDDAGNRSASVSAMRFRIDSFVENPTLATVAEDDRISHAETLAAEVEFRGTGEPGATVQLVLRAGGEELLYTAEVGAGGNWRIGVLSTVTSEAQQARSIRHAFGNDYNGPVDVSVVQTDRAGNVSPPVARSIYLRTSPVPDVNGLALAAADDTGSSASDGVTNRTEVSVRGEGPAGMVVRVHLDAGRDGRLDAEDVLLGEFLVGPDGRFSGPVSLPGAGTHVLLATAYDPLSGSTSVLENVPGRLTVLVDQQIDHASIDAVGGDDVLNDGKIASGAIAITGHGEPGARVSLVIRAGALELSSYANIPVESDGSWRVELRADDVRQLGSGLAEFKAVQTDLAGNRSVLANAPVRQVEIRLGDIPAPVALALAAEDDTGTSDRDGITMQATGLTLTGRAGPGDQVTVFRDADGNGRLDDGEALLTVGAADDGRFAADLNLPEGEHVLRAVAEDGLGRRSGASVATVVTVDQQAVTPHALQATADDMLNRSEAQGGSATLSGRAERASQVTLEVRSGSDLLFSTTVQAGLDGRWSRTLSPSELLQIGEGRQTLRVRHADLAGNVSEWAELPFVVDPVAPGAPLPASAAAADAWNTDPARPWRDGAGTGVLEWAELFRFEQGTALGRTLPLAVALADGVAAGDRLLLRWGSKLVERTVEQEDLDRGYALVEVDGTLVSAFRRESGQLQAEVTAQYVDAAGNAGASFAVMEPVAVSLERDPPQFQLAGDAFGSFDNATSTYYSRNGRDNADFQRRLLRVSGQAAPGEQVVIFHDADLDGMAGAGETLTQVTADGNGNFSASLSLAEGGYNLRAAALGAAGVASAPASEVRRVIVDVQPPAAPVVETISFAGDNLVNAAERDAGVAIQGTAEAHATVRIQLVNVSTGVIGTGVLEVRADAAGRWQGMMSLVQLGQVGDGELHVRVSQADRAGNVSGWYTRGDGSLPRMVMDTRAATATFMDVTSDNIINAVEAAGTLVLRGGAEPGASVTLNFNGASGSIGPVTVTASAQGVWQASLTAQDMQRLGNGIVQVGAAHRDVAGNTAPIATHTFEIDTRVAAPVIHAVAENDRVNAAEQAAGVAISGVAEAGASVVVRVLCGDNALPPRTLRAGDAGSWETTLSAADIALLGDGTATVLVTQTDRAGNVSVQSSRSFELATLALPGAVTVDPVTGDDQIRVGERENGITLSGTAPAGTVVQLRLQGSLGTLAPSAAVTPGGTWSVTLSADELAHTLGAGSVEVQASAVNGDQQSTALVRHSFTIERDEPAPTLSRVAGDGYVNQAEALSGIALAGGGEAGHLVDVRLVGASGTVLNQTVLVSEARRWQLELGAGQLAMLGEGAVQIQATQRNGAGPDALVSLQTTGSFVIDTQAPGSASASDIAIAHAYNTAQSDLAGGVTVAESLDGVVVAVPLPMDAAPGDRLVLRWGNQELVQVLGQANIPQQGSRVMHVTVPGALIATQGDGKVDILVVHTDAAGNAAPPVMIASQVDVAAPPPAPQFNAVYADGYINAAEYAQILQGGGMLSGSATPGGTVTLVLSGPNGTEVRFPGIAVSGGTWAASITSEQLQLLGEGRIAAAAWFTRADGVRSATSGTAFTFDRTAPAVPDAARLERAAEENARNELAGGLIRMDGQPTEASRPVQVHVALASDVVSGDRLLLHWGSQVVEYIVKQADVERSFAAVTVTPQVMMLAGDSEALPVEAQIVDRAGNTGARYAVWQGKVDAIPVTPVVAAVEGTGHVNLAKANAGWSVTGSGAPGCTVNVVIEGAATDADGQRRALVFNDVPLLLDEHGVPTWRVDLSLAQAQYLGEGAARVQATQTDPTGNASAAPSGPSDPGYRSFIIDLTPPAAPTIDPVTADNRISFAEGQAPVALTGSGESGATVTIVLSRGGVVRTRSAQVQNGRWAAQLLPQDLAELGGGAEPIQVQLRQTDLSGNESPPAAHSFRYTTDAVPVPAIDAVSGIVPGLDTYFNAADLAALNAAGNAFTVSGRGDPDRAGMRVRLTVSTAVGGTFNYLVDVVGGTWTRSFSAGELAALGQGKVVLSAVQIAPDGDESVSVPFASGSPDNAFTIDTAVPVLATVTVSANGQGGNAKAGDIVQAVVQASEALRLHDLDLNNPPRLLLDLGNGQTRYASYDPGRSAALGADRLVFTYEVVPGDVAQAITPAASIDLRGAHLSDAAGNPCSAGVASVATAAVRVDTSPPAAPVIASVDAAGPATPGGATVNMAEASAGVRVGITLTGTGAEARDTVELTLGTGASAVTVRRSLTQADIDAQSVAVVVSAAQLGQMEGSLRLEAALRDVVGNLSDPSAPVMLAVDTVAPAAPTRATWMGDDRINQIEAANGGAALTDLSGTGAEVGALLQATLRQGSLAFALHVTADGLGGWHVGAAQLRTVVAQLSDGDFSIEVSQTDAAGNTSPLSLREMHIDRVAPNRPAIIALPAAQDGWISRRDGLSAEGIELRVSLVDSQASIGDRLIVSGFAQDHVHILTRQDIENNLAVLRLGPDVVLQPVGEASALNRAITARIEDRGGNVSPPSANFLVNIDTNVTSPTVDNTRGAAAGVSRTQAVEPVAFYGAGCEPGAEVRVTFVGVLGQPRLVTTTAGADGSFSATLSPADMADLGDGIVTYSATQIDAALNVSRETTGSFVLRLSVPAPTLLTMTSDNVVSASEAGSTQAYTGYGVPGASLRLEFYIKDANGLFEADPRLVKNAVVPANGLWSVSLSSADFALLSPTNQGVVQIRARQTDGDTTSGASYQEFYIDRQPPALAAQNALRLFDGNGDGANRDGLLITFNEPVSVNELTKMTSYSVAGGKTLGTDARVEPVDAQSINGMFYATQFRLYLDLDSNLGTGDRITIAAAGIVDAGGNQASAAQVLTLPYLVTPGLPTPPVDIMDDNRINQLESSNITRIFIKDAATPAQIGAAAGGLHEISLNGRVVDSVIPKVNFLTLDLTLSRPVKLAQGATMSVNVRVTFHDNTTRTLVLYATGDAHSQENAQSVFRFTREEQIDLVNVRNITFASAAVNAALLSPVSSFNFTTTGTGASAVTHYTLALDFLNPVRLGEGETATTKLKAWFTATSQWNDVTLTSVGTSTTAAGTTRILFSGSAPGAVDNRTFYFNDVSGLGAVSLVDPVTVITSGVNAPVLTAAYHTSIVVPTDELTGADTVSSRLLDVNLNPVPGSFEALSYTAENPNQILYQQTVADALSAAGRKLQLFVDGAPVGQPVTMGISQLFLTTSFAWENKDGASSGWGSNLSLAAGRPMRAEVTVTFKDGRTRVLALNADGDYNLNRATVTFTGAFPPDINVSDVASITYRSGSVTPLHPNLAVSSATIMTSQLVPLPTDAWEHAEDGLKQLMAQITTADGTLTSVYSAPKQIRLDRSVGNIVDVTLQTDVNGNGVLDAGDTLRLRFDENVEFTFGALPAAFGVGATVTAVAAEKGYSTLWDVRLGTGASLAPGQRFVLDAGEVFDTAGNSNLQREVGAVIPTDLATRAGKPLIETVSGDNVVSDRNGATAVNVRLDKARSGDVVRLFMDGVQVGTQTVGSDGQSAAAFQVQGATWGADGERRLVATITRGSTVATSDARSVYVNVEQSHWSLESAYAGKIYWFDPDALDAVDGSVVSRWQASAGGITVENTVANTRTVKMTDPYSGRAFLMTDANSKFLETKVNGSYLYQIPTMARFAADTLHPQAGFTDFMMFKPVFEGSQMVLRHPTWRYTANSAPTTYTPLDGGAPVTVQPYTRLLKAPYLQYSFSASQSEVRSADARATGTWWDAAMINAMSVGAWQLVTVDAKAYSVSLYNQMRFNQSAALSSYIPRANATLPQHDYAQLPEDAEERRFRIAGNGAGVIGDQVSISVATNLAYQQEIGAYLAAKHLSTGSLVNRHANPALTLYDLSISNVQGSIIDQILRLNDIESHDVVITAGADYVLTGAGNDTVRIKDLQFRHLDAGKGFDTLVFDDTFVGPVNIYLSDYVSNARGLAGNAADNARVNDAGYHRLQGFERIDLQQVNAAANRRQVLTVAAADVAQLSETRTLEVRLGKEDVLLPGGFANHGGNGAWTSEGIYRYNDGWYDRRYVASVNGQETVLYSSGGDRTPEAVSVKAIPVLNQIQIGFDHAMLGNVLAGHFSVTTYTGPSVYVVSAASINLRQGVSLTFSGQVASVLKITYTGSLADEATRSFRHNTWIIGTEGSDTLNGTNLTAAEQARGVTFLGGAGGDTIIGTSGNDLIVGGLGVDIMTGGAGSDTFYFRNEISGSGGSGGLGGSSGDIITDFQFNAPNPGDNDRIDLSELFEANFRATGVASADARVLTEGGFLRVDRYANALTGHEDLQIWADRDGGGVLAPLVTLIDGGDQLNAMGYGYSMSSQQLLERLIEEGRIVVTH